MASGLGHLQKGHAIVFADLDQDGDQLVLMSTGQFGSWSVVDSVTTTPLRTNEAYSRIGDTWRRGPASPGTQNLTAPEIQVWGTGENRAAVYLFPTEIGFRYGPEYSESLDVNSWTVLAEMSGTGTEQSVSVSVAGENGYFRLRVK